jgi:hypothetical protein
VAAGAPPTIDELVLAADPGPWEKAGFDLGDGVVELGAVRLRLAGGDAGRGLVSWSVRDLSASELDGLPTEPSGRSPAAGGKHPNGVVAIDHVVAFSPDLDRTVEALRAAGLDFRRLREEPTPAGAPRQAFFRMGEVILEVIQAPDESPAMGEPGGPARLWGISLLVENMERAAEVLGERLGPARDAVQPGRLIATVRREAGLGCPVALMTPGPDAA